MENKNLAIGLLITAVIAISGVFANFDLFDKFGKASGPAHYQHESFLQGISGGARDQFSVSNVGVLTSSADAVFTSSNTATSSVTTGCIESYATSTETTVRLSATTTPGVAYWVFGACSGL